MVQIFVSYSHKNKSYLKKGSLIDYLKKELKGKARFWTDNEIVTGQHWDEKIHQNILASQMAVVLISPDFFKSRYIMNKEVDKFMTVTVKKFLVFPIIISPCKLQKIKWLNPIQYIPVGNQSIETDYPEGKKRIDLYKKISINIKKQITYVQKPEIAAGQALSSVINLINTIEPDLLSIGNKRYLTNKTHSLMFEGYSDQLKATGKNGLLRIVRFNELKRKLTPAQFREIIKHDKMLSVHYSRWTVLNAHRFNPATGRERKNVADKQRGIVLQMVTSLVEMLFYINKIGFDLHDHYAGIYQMLKLVNKTSAMNTI